MSFTFYLAGKENDLLLFSDYDLLNINNKTISETHKKKEPLKGVSLDFFKEMKIIRIIIVPFFSYFLSIIL